jgi:hypothetical protein
VTIEALEKLLKMINSDLTPEQVAAVLAEGSE